MSEFKGPWVRPNGNLITPEHYVPGEVRYVETLFPGGFNHHVKLPEDAVPLVPQSEVDAVKAQLAEAKADTKHAEGTAEYWMGEYDKLLNSLGAKATPSLPAVDFKDTEENLPQKLRAAAYLIDMQFDRLRSGDTSVAQILYDEADRLELEQADKAQRDNLVEAIARAIAGNDGEIWDRSGMGDLRRDSYRRNADALLDRFDITPKS